jgi:hypothetical protein
MVEFAVATFLLVPLLLGTFVTGMNLIKSIQANHVVRDLDDIYIHGGDFSSYGYQQLAQRVATGLNLQFPSFAGNVNSNTGATGDGIIWVTQIMYVGPTTAPQCQGVGAANCTNHDKFVFMQRIVFGNSTLTSQRTSFVGDPTGATLSSTGSVSNYVTDQYAALSTAGQTAIQARFNNASVGQTALGDGQVLYIVEGFLQTPSLSMGSYNSNGVYARYYF